MKRKRIQALFLTVIMLFTMTTNIMPVFAAGYDPDSGLCPHHTEHNIGCGYSEGSEGSPCEHKHDDTCGYIEAKEEVPCNKDCIDTDGDGVIDHADDCAYQPAVEGQECGHVVHDESCGYKEPVEPVPCGFVCPICDCTCTSLCDDGSVNLDCPVCSEHPENCSHTTVDVSLTFDKDYAEWGTDGGAVLTIAGAITGKKVTEARIGISLSDEEIAMLDVSGTDEVSLNGNQLVFTLVNDENTGKISMNCTIPVQADSVATLDIDKTDIQVSISPEEYQVSPYVKSNLKWDKITFVESLPTEDTYGSGTAYSAQVEDVTVHYVDQDGKAVSRQETAPTFKLYYQLDGESAVELQEGNLPFGLDEIPKISTAAGTDTWTGQVQDASALPSTVLVLQNGAYVEKDVTWFLKPSYPDGYYENAGKLVEITDENAGDYPAGLGRGWYFIGGEEPFPDDVVAVEEYLSNLKHDVHWADNANSDGKRPENLDGYYELQFSLDGSSDYTTLTEENLAQLGLKTIPQPNISSQSGVWQYSWQNSLPSKVSYSDSTGTGSTLIRDVNWRVVFNRAPESYAMVEVTPENAGDYSSVQDQYGTYYVLETTLTFTARIYQGNSDYDIENIREAFLEQFYLDASYSGGQNQYFQLAFVRDDGHYQPEENPDDPTLISVTITNLWRYNLDNTRINYSIREGTPEGTIDYRLTGVSGLDEGDYFSVSYDNSAVPSFSSVTTAAHSGGLLKLTLTGTMKYQATKVWLDDGEKERPTATMELWRYRSGQSYKTASLVLDADGNPHVLTLSADSENSDGTYNISFDDKLPKYDPEGYRYCYVVREYLSGNNADRYEQVFGVVESDGNVTDTLPEYSPRDENDTFLYNGGTLSNRLKGTIPVAVTKDWKAASFQSEFEDVMVVLRLQYRMKGQDDKWEDTEYTYQMFGFLAENLTVTHVGNYPQYDEWGHELEYQWVEESVWQGGKVEDGTYTGGHEVESSINADGSRSFTLEQNGREITYKSGCRAADEDAQDNCTVITNSIANVIDYDVTKEFSPEWNDKDYADSSTFTLFRATSGSDLERYATFTIDKDTKNDPPEITKYIDDGASVTVEQDAEWHVIIHGLPEFDADGQQYEYLLMEADGSAATITTERDDNGNYTSVVTNGPGPGNIILVRKEWVDESDTQHRLPVEITVYDKATNEPIGKPVVLGTSTWYQLVGIGTHKPDEVYILETKMGDTEIQNAADADGKPIPPTYEGTGTETAVQFSTEYHDYEATYSYDEDFGASSGAGAYEGMDCYTVTNRRLGNINLTVTKDWVDGNGEMRKQLQSALEKEGLNLAVKLEFMSEPSLGMQDVYEISRSGFGHEDKGDTVTISYGNPTAIQDDQGNAVDSVQLLDLEKSEQTLYFWNLPKYDGNGASVRYHVEEIFVDAQGNEVTDLTKYSDVAEIWREYSKTNKAGPYVVGKNHALDTQDFTLTNQLDNTTDVSWYTLWLDDFAYNEGSRPDIYLNIYARVHDADGNTKTELVISNYRWEFEEHQDDPDISQQNFWKCVIEGLPKYDDLGYEIDYFATMDSVVSTGDFDYLSTAYAPGSAINSDNVFATSDKMFGNADNKHLIEDVSSDPDTDNYALMSGNTFVNTIYNTITYSGEKLWTNLPDGYPLVDLPSVTFTLNRSTADGTEETNIATMTISGSDWQKLNVNGHYVFTFGHTGENEPASSFDEEAVPDKESLLPRFDTKGRLYTYTLTETVNWDGTEAGDDGAGDGIFHLSDSGQTFTNRYKDSGDGQLSVRKYLTVPAGEDVYPAVKFTLTRSYVTDDGTLSEPERVSTATWSASLVKAAVDAESEASGTMVTVDHVFEFTELPIYAPNGSKYRYTVTEDTSQLGGFVTWAAEGNQAADQVKGNGTKTNAVTGLAADTDPDIDATFLNEPEPTPDLIDLTGGKLWSDLNDDLRPDLTQGLTVTLERRANAQSGQSNAIGWQTVDITGKIIWGPDPTNEDRWIYTVTDLERYAPNGMPWIYRITEEPVPYYTAGNGGVANQKSPDSTTGDITMNDLTNSMLTNTYFKKTWVDSDGKTITENLLGEDIELEVRYELQVRTRVETTGAAWSDWQSADEYFASDSSLSMRVYNGTIRAPLGNSKWNQSYRGTDSSFNRLPLYRTDSTDTVYELEYRVVYTDVKIYRTGEDTPLLSQTYTAPLDNGSNPYAYTVSGDSTLFVPYYGAGKSTQANNTTTHKNQIETTKITVAKEWREDHNEVYQTRPKSTVSRYDWEVTLVVLCSTDGGTSWDPEPVETITLHGTNAENQKSATVSGLPAYLFDEDGELQPCTYRIQELQSKETTANGADREQLEEDKIFHGSYTVSYSDDGLTAINTLNTTEFQATKVWNDEEQTHSDVTLELKYLKEGGDPENPSDYEPFTPNAIVKLGDGEAEENPGDLLYYAKEDWKAVWEEVPQYVVGSEPDGEGLTTYKVFETVTGNYIIENEMDGNTATITNTPSVTPSVTKHWLGVSDTQEVTVVLYRKTAVNPTKEQVGTAVVLTETNNWSHTFDPQPKYDSNKNAYEYWVEETLIGGQDAADVAETGGYEISYGGSAESGFHVYNHKLGIIYVTKDWADVSDKQNRPTNLELTLQRTTATNPAESDWETVDDVTYTWEKGGDRWTTSFTDLPEYDIESGEAYTYRVTETVPQGYEQEIVSSDANTFHFKNTRSELIDIPVQKVWADNDNQLGYRPNSITVELYANGVSTGETLELKPGTVQNVWNFLTGSNTGWSGVFEDQPKYDDTGTLIEYSVVETSGSGHYQISYGEEEDGTQVITNTANGNLTVTKNVTGSGDLNAQFHFVVTLSDQSLNGDYGEMTFQNGVAEFTLKHGESKTAVDLPAGITYSVVEQEANQGAYTTASSGETGTIQPGDTALVSFTNDLSRISIDVSKVWQDNDNQDGIRPEEITVVLLANGADTGKTLTLNEGNDWTGRFTDLDEYDAGQKILYTVEEISVDGYETEISGDAENGFVITNTHVPETVAVSGSKTWDDEDNQDGKRPDSITIRLYADGTEMSSQTVTAEDDWAWNFEDLPKYEDGKKVQYTITEDAVQDYSTTYDGYHVTNSYTPGKTSVTVTKSWQDNNNRDGNRPDDVTMILLANGVETGDTLVLNRENNWTGSFTDLDEFKGGQKIRYTVKERSVDGYEAEIRGDAATGFTVINTYTASASTSTDGSPRTGDNSNLPLWIALLLVSGTGFIGVVFYKKRRRLK